MGAAARAQKAMPLYLRGVVGPLGACRRRRCVTVGTKSTPIAEPQSREPRRDDVQRAGPRAVRVAGVEVGRRAAALRRGISVPEAGLVAVRVPAARCGRRRGRRRCPSLKSEMRSSMAGQSDVFRAPVDFELHPAASSEAGRGQSRCAPSQRRSLTARRGELGHRQAVRCRCRSRSRSRRRCRSRTSCAGCRSCAASVRIGFRLKVLVVIVVAARRRRRPARSGSCRCRAARPRRRTSCRRWSSCASIAADRLAAARLVEPDHDEAARRRRCTVARRSAVRVVRQPDVVGGVDSRRWRRCTRHRRVRRVPIALICLGRPSPGLVVYDPLADRSCLRVAVVADVDRRERRGHAAAGPPPVALVIVKLLPLYADRLVGAARVTPVVVLDDVVLAVLAAAP